MSLYHYTYGMFAAGSVIEPGNWGRVTEAEQLTPQGGFFRYNERAALGVNDGDRTTNMLKGIVRQAPDLSADW